MQSGLHFVRVLRMFLREGAHFASPPNTIRQNHREADADVGVADLNLRKHPHVLCSPMHP